MERQDKERRFGKLPDQPKPITAIDPKTGMRARGTTRANAIWKLEGLAGVGKVKNPWS